MKTELCGISEKHRIELDRITHLIKEHVSVDLIILFGKYADGKMKSVLGGYELLLVTKKEPVDVYELDIWLKKVYCYTKRIEKKIFLHSYSETYINTRNSANYFFLRLRNEGIVLHDNELCHLFSKQRFKSTRAYMTVYTNFEYYYKTSTIFLDYAQKAWVANSRCIAALNLRCAAELLFKTVETVFYGDISQGSLIQHYQQTRHFSEKLYRHFNLHNIENQALFKYLDKYRREICDDPYFSLPQKRYLFCIGKLKTLQEIVHSICKERIDLIEKCKKMEISID